MSNNLRTECLNTNQIYLSNFIPMEVNLSIMTKDQLKKFIVELEKENKKLKKDLEFVYGWKDQLEKENKELKEKLNKAWLEEYWFFNEY